MTFNDYEYSKRSSNPIDLYYFYNSTDEWFFCSGTEETFAFGGDNYSPLPIKHNDINYSQNSYDEKLDISVPTGSSIITDNIGMFQGEKIYLKIYRIQNNDPALYSILWYGYIVNFIYNSGESTIRTESIVGAFNKRVIKNIFSYQCRHILYGDQCGLLEASNKTAGTFTAISGTSVSAVAFNTGTPGTFLGSLIVTEDGEKRVITEDLGAGVVSILRPFREAAVATTFYVTTKCTRLITGLCTTKSNTANFGGWQFIRNNPYKELNSDSGAILTNPVT